MKLWKTIALSAALAGAAGVGAAYAPVAHGQSRAPRATTPRPAEIFSFGNGSRIGVSITDLESEDVKGKVSNGVVVDDVDADSPAEKAGLKKGDVIVEFDGERVRSARQFGRLVQETPPGRPVKATITREGRRQEVQITPSEGRGASAMIFDGERMRDRLGDLAGRIPDMNFNFDFDMPALSGRRLGVTVDELTNQLAEYFGAKDGVLVTAVTQGSAAEKAGLKAGDVITSINGERVTSREDVTRGLREATNEDVKIGIVRDRKESTVTAKIEPVRRPARGRPA